MRTGAPADHTGCFHEAVIYDSDDELLAILVPYLEAGIAAGEPAVAWLSTEHGALVRSAMNGATAPVTFLPALSPRQERPPRTIKLLRSLLGDLVAAGAHQIRVVTTIPHPGLGAPWDGWCRYEAAVNHLLGDLPMWGLCLYDRRITPATVLADVQRTHPHLAAGARHVRNDRYQNPMSFLRSLPDPPIDPLEAEQPAVELTDARPAASRQAVRDVAPDTRLTADDVEQLVLVTSEAVSNALEHGRPPVRVRLWAAPRRMVVAVSDRGDGPRDVYAGLVPKTGARRGGGGFGLWLMNQLSTVVDTRDANGYTVHLLVGDVLPLHHGGDGEPGVGFSP